MDNLGPCPVCGKNDWEADYDFGGEGDEILVYRCESCQWPPPYPVTVDEWREKQGIKQTE